MMLRLIRPVLFKRFYTTRYTPDHEWIKVTDGVGTIGITNYAQDKLGDVVYVETPSIGSTVVKKDAIAAVESVKAASDIYAPVSGEIVAINESLGESPSLINSSATDQGDLYSG